jgi:hypothetical protein
MRSLASILVVAGFAMAASIGSASAAQLTIHFPGELIKIGGLWCPPGTHPGYEEKHCWANHGRLCPPGYHIGYEGKYCWRNK